MEVLTLNGKQYVKASKAAKDLGYASDYVGQLCRSGAVDAHLVGRTWYVNPETLGAHRVDKKRNARVKAREYAKKSIEEVKQLRLKENTNKAQNIVIHYEKDPQGLIPEVKQVHVAREEHIVEREVEEDAGPSYEMLNVDKKIVMSGKIQVFDAEEETALTDVTILTPKLMRHTQVRRNGVAPSHKEANLAEEGDEAHSSPEIEEEEVAATAPTVPISFMDRLRAENSNESGSDVPLEEASSTLTTGAMVEKRSMVLGFLFRALLTVLVLVAIATLFVQFTYEFTDGELKTVIEFVVPNFGKSF